MVMGLKRGALRVKISKARKRKARSKKKSGFSKVAGNLSFSGPRYTEKWSYKTVSIFGNASLGEKLNEFGKNGWELVSATPDTGSKIKCIFKRCR